MVGVTSFIEYLNRSFFETTFKYVQIVLIWFPDKKHNSSQRVLKILLFILAFSIFAFSFAILELIHLCLNISDYVQTIRTMSVVMFHLIYMYKLFAWMVDKNTAILCIDLLHRKSFNFENFENIRINFEMVSHLTPYFVDKRFQNHNLNTTTVNLEEFWIYHSKQSILSSNKPTDRKSIKDVQFEITRETNIHCSLLIISLIIAAVIAIFFIFLEAIYISIMGIFFGKVQGNLQLPINFYNPFDENNINIYAAQSIYSAAVSTFITMQYLGIDFFFWSMMIHMDGQLRVIQYALKSIDTVQDATYICKMNMQFSKCMHELQQLIKLMDCLRSIYSTPLLLQYIFVVIVCCCVLYSMTQEENILVAIGLMGFAACALTNSFFNIFYITQLTHQFAETPNAIYKIDWVGTNSKFQRQIVFAMSRMQKTIGIKMGNMIEVNLNVFIKILQTTYSFFTLLVTTKIEE